MAAPTKNRGQNKGRRFRKVRDSLDLCWKLANGIVCEFGDDCRFSHDIQVYLANKPGDLTLPTVDQVLDGIVVADPPSICPIFQESGECRFGFKCRFLHSHITTDAEEGPPTLLKDNDKIAQTAFTSKEMNYISPDVLKSLRTKKYPLPKSDTYLSALGAVRPASIQESEAEIVIQEPEQGLEDIEPDADALIEKRTGDSKIEDGIDLAKFRFEEKKRLDWKGLTYLAPLTTVGNLPFRRLCISYGADITCGEMSLTPPLLSGSKEEWSLLRRHPSESRFGVQIAGNKPGVLVPAAEVIAKEFGLTGLDFVDVNCGCPIDLVFKAGSGSALLSSPSKLSKILSGMNYALGEIPLTVKFRTGVKDGKNVAERLMLGLVSGRVGVGGITLHGRSRQQRYTRLADWDYIKRCVEVVRAKEEEEDLPPVQLFGNGDIFSASGYHEILNSIPGISGLMIARGALIKPWIFTEVKECREWDISARERLEGIRRYVEYGLSHFGADTTGVNATRRYLCEALSFQHRYVPVGLLERLPPKINERVGVVPWRDELETLLASPDSKDWVKVSEIFLGPAPETWKFIPKHKSNAYENDNFVQG